MRVKITASLVASAAAVTLALTGTPVAHASAHNASHRLTWSRDLTDKVVAPFQLAVHHGRVYVADGGTSTVSLIERNGDLATVAQGPQPGEVAGLDIAHDGRSFAYTFTDYSTGKTGLTIKRFLHDDVTADLSTYETTRNPDRNVTYGVPASTNQCAKDAIAKASGAPATYTGLVDSHPYAVVSVGGGKWVVADAAGNDLLLVDARGHISTLAVLPRQPLVITQAIANGMGLPACTVGVTYNFEPVPTDVEVDPWGGLLVSTLPGGPEDPSAGARGSVYWVSACNGHAYRVATGFAGATNVAMGDNGTIYVTELFAGRISQVRHGHTSTFVQLANAVSVETSGRSVYAGTLAPFDDQGNPMGNGSVKVYRR